jgi:hypothetical protein
MKALKSIRLALGVLALCVGFGVAGSFLANSSVHAADRHQVSVASDQEYSSQVELLAVQTAQEATDLTQ